MLWSRARSPRIPARLALAATEGPSAQATLLDALERRRDRNPGRFDRNHPRLGPFLAGRPIPLPAVVTPPIPPPTLPPVTAPDPMQVPTLAPISPPRHPMEQTVPEPSTVIMTMALVGWGVWWRRSSRRPS